MLNQQTILLVLVFLVLVYLISNQTHILAVTTPSALVDRTGADWNRSGSLVGEVGLDNKQPEPPFTEEPVTRKGNLTPWVEESVTSRGLVAPWTSDGSEVTEGRSGGPGFRDSYSQLKMQDEIYPNYYNKYEVTTSDYYPWWTNQHFWPYYTRSHNWMYRYPYYSSWRRPYFYNYWASPYYPSRTVLIKPYLRDMARKQVMTDKLALDFRRAKINDSPRST